MNAKRTQGMWRHSGNQIVSGAREICEMSEQHEHGVRKANAQFIVTAANCHDELVAALEHCLLEHGGYTIRGETERKARAALAKVRT